MLLAGMDMASINNPVCLSICKLWKLHKSAGFLESNPGEMGGVAG